MTSELYVTGRSEGFEFCHPRDAADFEALNTLAPGCGERASAIEMEVIRREAGEDLMPSDSPWLGEHLLVFRRRALTQASPNASLTEFGELVSAAGELWPVCSLDDDLVMFMPSVVNALDVKNSIVSRFSSGRIVRVVRYEFRETDVVGRDALKIPDLRVSPIFVSGAFVEAWRSAELSGLEFRKVWTRE